MIPSTELELVTVVIATVDRPILLRHAVRAALAQDYPGEVQVLVVYDQTEIDPLVDIDVPPRRSLTVHVNRRTAGLAGSRNTGVLAASGTYIAFCDDDDAWERQKLTLQMAAWRMNPSAVAIATGIRIMSEAAVTVRLPPISTGFGDLLKSRVSAIHPSSLVYRRSDLLGTIGLVDETLPSSYGEDYDLLLRATRFGKVLSVQQPLVLVRWGQHSMYSGKWEVLAAGLTRLLQKFPEFESSRSGTARIAGQVAFAYAALGQRRLAWRWAASALTRNPSQIRALAALLLTTGIVSAEALLALAQKYGRGV